ncbi:hypothetical protein [Streptococcus suis]|uniref:hypothetical protein n=1 Tax=Streptococcus suis TaxID=1307 RepID=UPI00240F6364|nr:hypothetical protein [Streptococcus suis]MDG3136724.1 hypothetical protein [Streptococcus suis]
MIKKAKVLSVSKKCSDGFTPSIVAQEFLLDCIPGTLHNVYCQRFFEIKVGQWVYIDDYFNKVVGVVEDL